MNCQVWILIVMAIPDRLRCPLVKQVTHLLCCVMPLTHVKLNLIVPVQYEVANVNLLPNDNHLEVWAE